MSISSSGTTAGASAAAVGSAKKRTPITGTDPWTAPPLERSPPTGRPHPAAVGGPVVPSPRPPLDIAELIAAGALPGIDGRERHASAAATRRIDLDIAANAMCAPLRNAAVAAIVSEEMGDAGDPAIRGDLCVAIDPLDGSSNIDVNMSIGTIFSILPRGRRCRPSFFQPGGAAAPRASSSTVRRPRWF